MSFEPKNCGNNYLEIKYRCGNTQSLTEIDFLTQLYLFAGKAKLRNEGPRSDVHPADIVRGYLAAETVRLLSFKDANAWGDVLEQETDKDLQQVRLAGQDVSEAEAKESARIVAKTLVQEKAKSLEHHALGEIQDWRDEDEQMASQLRSELTTLRSIDTLPKQFYAAHAVAAAVTAAVATGGDIPVVFDGMLTKLKQMHDRNPSWGLLYISHPGDIIRHVAYQFNQFFFSLSAVLVTF